jgi:hypothetical protein
VKKSIAIPIYGGKLTIHVTKNMEKSMVEVGYEGELECDACCFHSTAGKREYDLIFKKDILLHGLIAHEIFHLTMRVMDQIKKPYDIKNDEPEAYLNQYLTTEVYSFLKESEVTVN